MATNQHERELGLSSLDPDLREKSFRSSVPGLAAMLGIGGHLFHPRRETSGVTSHSNVVVDPSSSRGQDSLAKAVYDYKTDPYDPKIVRILWQSFWSGGIEGHSFDVPDSDFDLTRDQLQAPVEGLGGYSYSPMTVSIPEQFEGRSGLIKAGRIWPEMGNWSVSKGTDVDDHDSRTGSVKVEAMLDSPNIDVDEKIFSRLFDPAGRHKGQRLLTFIIAAQACRFIYRRYPDENVWSKLSGSSLGGHSLIARFATGGGLVVFPSPELQYSPDQCNRSEVFI